MSAALAIPSQFGDSGLLNEPTANTLDAGNICLGIWGNCNKQDNQTAVITPVSITLGLGSFLEMYGSYPSLLFNGDEDSSGRGFVNLGAKLRFWGSRSSKFKIALDGQFRRTISDRTDLDGLTDYLTRVVASFRYDRFGLHVNGGYIMVEEPDGAEYDDQVTAGAGIELFPMSRLRLLAEISYQTEKIVGEGDIKEAMVGIQYYFSPHFTLNLGVGYGLSDGAGDWRLLAGLTSCQGIGTYRQPIPELVEPALPKPAPVKKKGVVKIKTLTPLIPGSREEASSKKPKLTPIGQKEGLDSQQKATSEPKLKPIGKRLIPGFQEEATSEPKLKPIGRRTQPKSQEEATSEPKLKPIGQRTQPRPQEEATREPPLKPVGSRETEDGQREAARPAPLPPVGQQGAPDRQEEASRIRQIPPVGQQQPPDNQEEASRLAEFPPVSLLEVPVDREVRHEVVLSAADRLDVPYTEKLQARYPAPVAPSVPFAVSSGLKDDEELELNGLVYRRFLLTDVNFEADQSGLSVVGQETLSEIAELLRKDRNWYLLRFDGHTDNVGSESYNERLSRRRAAAAASYFVSHSGFDPARLFVRGFGESEAIADNETEEGRAQNRRVEIIVLEPKGML